MRQTVIKKGLAVLLGLFIFLPSLALANSADLEHSDLKNSNLEKINKRGVLRVSMSSFVPWAMRDKQGELMGFEIDVATRLAKDSGWKVQFVPTAWDGIIPALLSDKSDVIISGLSINPERSKSLLFTEPYAFSGVQVAVNKVNKPGVKTITDLNSRRVKIAVRRGTYNAQVAREFFPKAKLLQFDDEPQVFQEVLNGNADAFLSATPMPEFETLKHPDVLYLPFKERLSKGREGFAVRLGEDDKKAFFDAWIAKRKEDGWLQERYDYWFSTLGWEDKLAKSKE